MPVSRRQMMAMSASVLGSASATPLAFAACEQSLSPSGPIGGPPEYIPGAPLRSSLLEPGATGQRIKIFGRALTTKCESLSNARLDFWHTDGGGKYDMTSYRFRGALHTNEQGGFTLETVMPGPYLGARHVHFLLATRLGNSLQTLMLSGGIFFPTPEEFAQAKPDQRTREFLDPRTLRTVDGMLIAPCDIVVETA